MPADLAGHRSWRRQEPEPSVAADPRPAGHVRSPLASASQSGTARADPNSRHGALLAGALVCTAAGLGVMLAWGLGYVWLLRPDPTATPIVFNTGVAFALVGAAMTLAAWGRARRGLLPTAGAAALAAASLAEQLFDRSLGVDQLFFRTSVAPLGAVPGRMPANTAVSFLVVCALLVARAARPGRAATAATVVGAGVVLAISGSAAVGYALDEQEAYQWGRFTPMALPTAVLFGLVAAELLGFSWTDGRAVPSTAGTVGARTRISRWSLRRVVALLAVVTYVPLVSMAAFGVSIASRAVTAEAEGRLQAAATLEARAVKARLEGLRALSHSMASRPTIVDAAQRSSAVGPGALQALLDDLVSLEDGVVSAGLTDARGTLLAVSPATPEILGQDFSYRDWYRGASTSGDVYVSEAVQSAAEGHRFVVAIAAPVRVQRGPAVGYFSLGYELGAVQDFVTGFELAQNVQLVVTDQRGVVVAAPDEPDGLVALDGDRAVQAGLRGETGVRTQPSEDGSQLVGYAPVEDIGWTVTARVKRSVALARVGTLRAAATAVALVIAAALTVVLVLVARTWRARIEAERERDEALTDLNRSNAELEQFAYAASHDLSEPLRAISGPISLVARRYKGRLDPESDQFIDFAVDGCDRMQHLIDALLAYSRVGRLEVRRAPVDCDLLLRNVLDGLGPAIAEAGASVEAAPLPTVVGEANQLGQVFGNLVANAIKFSRTDEVPLVRVAAERLGADWRFTVTDNGIGIAPEHRERIFGMFKRLHNRDAYEGTGIGLALVRKIVERHGGVAGVEDNPDGPGCQFWFTIPAGGAQR